MILARSHWCAALFPRELRTLTELVQHERTPSHEGAHSFPSPNWNTKREKGMANWNAEH